MLEILYKLLLTLSSTSWVVVIFCIKEEYTLWKIPSIIFGLILLVISILISLVSLLLATKLSKDNFIGCKAIENVNNAFIPTYLGYFFVGLSIGSWHSLVFVYLIIFVFILLSQNQYFNPIYLLFGFHFYSISTNQGSKILVIARSKVRYAEDVKFNNLRRINDTTFIELRKIK